MRTNDPSTRPYSSWQPSQSFASTRAYRESNCDPSRRARTKTQWKRKKRIPIFEFHRFSSAIRLAILAGRGVRSENTSGIHEKFTIITRQDAQRIFNSASTGGHPPVFFSPPLVPFLLTRLTVSYGFEQILEILQRVRSRQIRPRDWNIFIQGWFSLHFCTYIYARMIMFRTRREKEWEIEELLVNFLKYFKQ